MSAKDLFHEAVRRGLEKDQWRISSDVGQELIDMGIPKEGIVLGLHPAYKRPYTGYGVA